MNELLFQYHPVPSTTWFYLSSLLMIGLFFKFSRLWSVRNLDLLGIILLAPGLLLVELGRNNLAASAPVNFEQVGYVWLFVTGGLFLVRLLLDPMMVRRPLLEPNLSVGGLSFLGISFIVFLAANVLTGKPTRDDLAGPAGADQIRARHDLSLEHGEPPKSDAAATAANAPPQFSLERQGPGFPLLFYLPTVVTQKLVGDESEEQPHVSAQQANRELAYVAAARIMAILSHLAIVIGMVVIGYRHFDNVKTGIAAAVLYLMLPYTNLLSGSVGHVLPAALLIWAVEAYRRPLISGMLMGLAIGAIYYPVFLLPLWFSFYWPRGLLRFASGMLAMIGVLVGVLAFTSSNFDAFLLQARQMFGWTIPSNTTHFQGFWETHDPVFRITVLAAFVVVSCSLALWPAQKNLGTLLSCSAAIMLGTQYWHAHGGGLYMAWFLPLMLLTIFRPNLEDRVALSVLGNGWTPRRLSLFRGERAA